MMRATLKSICLHLVGLVCIALLASCQPIDVEKTSTDNNSANLALPTSVGQGTAASPCTVWQVLDGTSPRTDVYVAGYVVGYATNTINKSTFGAQGAPLSNILLAPSPNTRSTAQVVTVQLDRTTMRRAVSLAYNPDSLGRAVMLHVNAISQYLYTTGLRDNDNYLWLGDAGWLDLNYGHPTISWNEDPDDEGDEGDDADTPTTATGQYHTGTEIWGIYNSEDLKDVKRLNDHTSFASDEDLPYTIDFIIYKFEGLLQSQVTHTPTWMVGYVRPYNDDYVEVYYNSAVYGNHSMLMRLENGNLTSHCEDIKQWIRRTMQGKEDRLLRICGRLKTKYVDGRPCIINVQSLDWLIPVD